MNKYFLDLNIPSILEIYQKYLKTERGKESQAEPKYFKKYEDFAAEHQILDEAFSIITKFGTFPIYSSNNIETIISYGDKGGAFDTEMFSKIYNDVCTSIYVDKYFKLNIKEFVNFTEKFKGFTCLKQLKDVFDRVFDDTFLVKDEASGNLKSIRRKLKLLETQQKTKILDELRKYKELLNDATYYIRNNVFVLPVKTSYKNRVDGLVYDISDSGETTFIQPTSCFNIANEFFKEQVNEKEEISKILRALTNETMIYSNELRTNNEIFSLLDILNAKYSFAKEIGGIVLKTTNDSSINILDGRHPLIDKEKVVSNDIIMNTNINQLIISGPNAGGKSVLLKMIGVFIVLNQMILPVPCREESSIGFFRNIYSDIGDLQSIEHNLSTFSAHISNISSFLNKITNRDIILIDELGTGTDPNDGESLAIAICKYLKSTNCKSIITSHFEGMKKYSYETDDTICGSMVFDEKNMTPHYKLQLGIPGSSYGILIAKKYGVNEDIINDAYDYLHHMKDSANDKYLAKLDQATKDAAALKEDYQNKVNELQAKISSYEKNIEVLQGKLNNFDKEANLKKQEIIEETLEKIEEIKAKMIKNPNLKLHDLIAFEKDLNEEHESLEEIVEGEAPELKIGDYIKDDFSEISGTVIAIKKEKFEIETLGGKKYTLKLSPKIKIIPKPAPKVENKVDTYFVSTNMKLELNLIGKHVDEAIDELQLYLNQAIACKKDKIRIIHGYGTGALRTAVHEFLRKNKHIKSFTFGGQFDGGQGATIAYLK